MSEVIHELPAEIDGCTHVREGRFHLDRAAGVFEVELRGGRIIDGEFQPVRASGRETQMEMVSIGPELWSDFEAFCEEFEQIPEEAAKPLAWRAGAALLAYTSLLQTGERVPEPTEE